MLKKRYDNIMPTFYHCPRCKSFRVKVLKTSVFCSSCKLTFDKKSLKILRDEEILANEELKGIIDVFAEDKEDADDLTLIP